MSEEEKTEEAKEPEAAGGDDAPPPEEESTANFEPVVKLEEVEVNSGEEDEDAVYQERAKLYIFGETMLDKGTGTKSWKERGIGDVRILRHKEHGRLRLVMRQEKTMKLIANHALDPRIELEPNVGSDRSWVWNAFDFSEGELEETFFAIKFSNSDVADNFKEKFIELQKEMEAVLAGEDKPDEGGEAEEVANALAELSTKEDDETKAADPKD